MKTNYTLVKDLLVAGIVTDWNKEIKDITEAEKVEIQIDWAGLTGTLDATIQVYEKLSTESAYVLRDDVKSLKVLSTAAGKWIFSWPEWVGYGIKIVVTKNNCTSGSLTIGIGIR